MRAQLVLSLVLATASVTAIAAPEIRSSNTITNADGSQLELSTRFHAPTRGGLTLNKAAIEVVQIPPEPVQPGEGQPPDPIRYRIEGTFLKLDRDLVRLELRSEERVLHVRSDATDSLAALALGNSRKVVRHGGPLSPGWARHPRECQGNNDNIAGAARWLA
jgi:hypothetical protein